MGLTAYSGYQYIKYPEDKTISRSRRVRKAVEKELLKAFQLELQRAAQAALEKRQIEQLSAGPEENGAALKKSRNRIYKTNYKPEFCEMLLKHAEEGKNLTEFAGKVEVSLRTIENWARKYPEFKEATEIAKLKLESYWWDLARKHMKEKFSYDLFLFVMVNLFGYRNPDLHINFNEKQEIKGGVVILPEAKTMEEILNDEL